MGGIIKTLRKQDRCGTRQASDVERKYNLEEIEPLQEDIKRIESNFAVDTELSATSYYPVANKTLTDEFAKKVNKQAGKDLSSNDFTDAYKETLDNLELEPTSYNLETYKASGVTVKSSSCYEKFKRVCMDFVGTRAITVNAETTILNLPTELKPKTTKNFLVVGEDTTGIYLGYGQITAAGLVTVIFGNGIDSNIRFSTVYDLD